MRSHGYRSCPSCGTSVPPRKQYCSPCVDARREEREAKYRQQRREAKEQTDE